MIPTHFSKHVYTKIRLTIRMSEWQTLIFQSKTNNCRILWINPLSNNASRDNIAGSCLLIIMSPHQNLTPWLSGMKKVRVLHLVILPLPERMTGNSPNAWPRNIIYSAKLMTEVPIIKTSIKEITPCCRIKQITPHCFHQRTIIAPRFTNHHLTRF